MDTDFLVFEAPSVTGAVASRRNALRSDDNATNLLCCACLQRKFFAAYSLIMRRNFLIIGAILCSHLLSVAAHAADQNSPAFEAGITVLLKQELAKQADCANNEPSVCDDSEVVAFLKILGLYQPIEQPLPTYPVSAQRRGVNAVVISELSIGVNGQVENVSTVECKSGDGDTRLQWKWKIEGELCSSFSRAAAKSHQAAKFPSLAHLNFTEPRTVRWRTSFALEGTDSGELNSQIVDIDETDLRKINRFIKKTEWDRLSEFTSLKVGEHPLYEYYLGYAALQAGRKAEGLPHFESFLEQTSGSYFHYGATASSVLADEYYRLGDYDQVIRFAGEHYNLRRYFGNDQMFSAALVAQSLLFYGSALTLVKPPRIGEAVMTFQALKDHLSLVEPVAARESLEQMTSQQLTRLVSQIEALGQ